MKDVLEFIAVSHLRRLHGETPISPKKTLAATGEGQL